MILSILGLVAVIVATYHVYKTARDNGRNGIGWGFLTVAVGLGAQWILPIIATAILVVVYATSLQTSRDPYAARQQMEELESYALIFGIAGLIISFIGLWLIMRFVSRIPEDGPGSSAPPPPPPSFGGAA
jgi:uncharacterized membrane protein